MPSRWLSVSSYGFARCRAQGGADQHQLCEHWSGGDVEVKAAEYVHSLKSRGSGADQNQALFTIRLWPRGHDVKLQVNTTKARLVGFSLCRSFEKGAEDTCKICGGQWHARHRLDAREGDLDARCSLFPSSVTGWQHSQKSSRAVPRAYTSREKNNLGTFTLGRVCNRLFQRVVFLPRNE